MTHWNYRVFRIKEKKNISYEIREVYYNKNGEIKYYSASADFPGGDTVKELISDLGVMIQAINKPVINLNELENKLLKRNKKIQLK